MLYIGHVSRLFICLSVGLLVVASDEATERNTEENADREIEYIEYPKDEVLVSYPPFIATYDPQSFNQDPVVTIKFDPKAVFDPVSFKDPTPQQWREEKWMLMKQLIMNELHGMSKRNTGFLIKPAGISKLYDMVQTSRGADADTLKNSKMYDKIRWLLKELSVVKPDPLMMSIYANFHPDPNKQYFISHVLRTILPSIIVVHEQSRVLESDEGVDLIARDVVSEVCDGEKRSGEFEEFCQVYLPILVQYAADEVDGTSKSGQGPDVFSARSSVIYPYVREEEHETEVALGNPLDIAFKKF